MKIVAWRHSPYGRKNDCSVGSRILAIKAGRPGEERAQAGTGIVADAAEGETINYG
jgi:hypothetical protein